MCDGSRCKCLLAIGTSNSLDTAKTYNPTKNICLISHQMVLFVDIKSLYSTNKTSSEKVTGFKQTFTWNTQKNLPVEQKKKEEKKKKKKKVSIFLKQVMIVYKLVTFSGDVRLILRINWLFNWILGVFITNKTHKILNFCSADVSDNSWMQHDKLFHPPTA